MVSCGCRGAVNKSRYDRKAPVNRRIRNSVCTCVYVGVLLHVGLLVEAFAAELARVGTRVGVDEQVSGERGRALEALAALAALEAALGAVHGPVLAEADGVTERLAARAALVRTTTSAVRSPSVHLPVRQFAWNYIHLYWP